MRTLAFIALAVALIVGGVFVWWKINYPTYSYRIRMTVAVDVDGERRTGSSVIEIIGQTQPQIGGAPATFFRYRGDAVFVDIGNGRHVIATLGFGPNGSADLLYTLVPTLFRLNGEEIAAKLAGSGRRAELPDKLTPTLVTFADLNDPKTARVVGLGEFEQVFGQGVHFKGAWIEMTNKPVTKGNLEKQLPWIAEMKASGLDGRIETHPGRFIVNVPYFTRS